MFAVIKKGGSGIWVRDHNTPTCVFWTCFPRFIHEALKYEISLCRMSFREIPRCARMDRTLRILPRHPRELLHRKASTGTFAPGLSVQDEISLKPSPSIRRNTDADPELFHKICNHIALVMEYAGGQSNQIDPGLADLQGGVSAVDAGSESRNSDSAAVFMGRLYFARAGCQVHARRNPLQLRRGSSRRPNTPYRIAVYRPAVEGAPEITVPQPPKF